MLKLAFLCTRRAPGLAYLLRGASDRGRDYELVAALTTDPQSEALPLLRAHHVPALVHDVRRFDRREDFDARTAELLAPYEPDLVILSGYLHVVTAPLLDAYPGRIVNVHDADLTLLTPDGRPRYPGLHATRDAIRAGESVTRCSAHIVTADVDAGPLLARSAPYPVDGRHHYLQREWMMRDAWGPLIVRAMHSWARRAAVAAVGAWS